MKFKDYFYFFKKPLFISAIGVVFFIIVKTQLNEEILNENLSLIVYISVFTGILITLQFIFMARAYKDFFRVYVVAKRFNLDSLGNDKVLYDPLVIEIGYGLFPLVKKDKGAELVNQAQVLRKNLSTEKGIVVPKVRIVDNPELGLYEYRITTSRLGEIKLNEDELSDGARVITKDLKDIIVRLYEEKEIEQYPSVREIIYNMHKKGTPIEDIAKKMNRSENNIRIFIETSEMNEKLKEMGYHKAVEEE